MNQIVNQDHRNKINALSNAMREGHELIDPDLNHYFAHGTYVREMFLPKGVVLTGKIHRFSCVNIISLGKLLIVTDEGEFNVSAPHTFVSGAGVSKAIYALEDSVIINVHPWDGEENLKMIENELIISPCELLGVEL